MGRDPFHGVWGECDKRRRCRREGGGYGPQVCEVWWAGVQCESRMIRKSDNHPNRERGGERKEQKKRPKIGKDPRTKSKKTLFFVDLQDFASTPQPSQKATGAALWTTDGFGLSIGHLTYFQFI